MPHGTAARKNEAPVCSWCDTPAAFRINWAFEGNGQWPATGRWTEYSCLRHWPGNLAYIRGGGGAEGDSASVTPLEGNALPLPPLCESASCGRPRQTAEHVCVCQPSMWHAGQGLRAWPAVLCDDCLGHWDWHGWILSHAAISA